MNQENVLDEAYRKAGKMDSDKFAPVLDLLQTDLMRIIRGYLLEGTQSTQGIRAELYKLNVYGTHLSFVCFYSILCCCPDEGSFFKPHVDTPRSDLMFGSLVLVFPTPHDGGALLLRHRGHEWTFDPGKVLAAADQPSIGYVAFFSDIEHEVTPVVSGHRVTLTYNLYFEDDGDDSVNNTVSKHLTLPNKGTFHEAFTTLLENPEFLAEGGTLAFGLRHVYPIEKDLNHVHKVLKGGDAVVYQSLQTLGFEPLLYLYYDHGNERAIIDKVVEFPVYQSEEDIVGIVYENGGFPVAMDNWEGLESDFWLGKPEPLNWVTPLTEFNRKKDAFLYCGNEASLRWAYGDVCLVVRVGKAGERSVYPTAAMLNKARSLRRPAGEEPLDQGLGVGWDQDQGEGEGTSEGDGTSEDEVEGEGVGVPEGILIVL